MPRRKVDPPAPPPAAPAAPVINPEAVFSLDDARQVLRLKRSSLSREIRERRLRVSKRCGRYFITGRWLMEWLEAGELKKRPAGVPGQN